jgi:predicted DNA binding CopG/RHH family protein
VCDLSCCRNSILSHSQARCASPFEKSGLAKLKPSTETISLRLPKYLLDSIRQIANSRDVPYQSLIKIWLQEHAVERR